MNTPLVMRIARMEEDTALLDMTECALRDFNILKDDGTVTIETTLPNGRLVTEIGDTLREVLEKVDRKIQEAECE